MKNSILPFIIILLISSASFIVAQNVGISNSGITPDASAMLDIQSDDKGLLTPRMTTAQRQAIPAPANGLVVYDTDTGSFWFYDENMWQQILHNRNMSAPLDIRVFNNSSIGTGFREVEVQGNYLYALDELAFNSMELKVVDVSNPEALTLTGSIGVNGSNVRMVVQDNFVYSASSFELQIIDVSNPAMPTLAASVPSCGSRVAVKGNFAYSPISFNGNGSCEMQVIDISNPAAPVLEGSVDLLGLSTGDMATDGNYVYMILNANRFQVIDVSNPATPTLMGSLVTGSSLSSIVVRDNFAYLEGTDEMLIIDVSNPASPVLAGSLALIGSDIRDIQVQNNFAYLADINADDIKVVDISDPTSPTLESALGLGFQTIDLAVQNNFAYVVGFHSTDIKTIQLSHPLVTGTGINGALEVLPLQNFWKSGANGEEISTFNSTKVGIGTNNVHSNFQAEITGSTTWGGGVLARGNTAGVVLGELNGTAQIGGHNAAATAWADLAINSGGGNVSIGGVGDVSIGGGGNVGIGAAPASLTGLTVRNPSPFNLSAAFKVQGFDGTDRFYVLDQGHVGINTPPLGVAMVIRNPVSFLPIIFRVESSNGANLFHIRENGNVGIGLVNPLSPLHIFHPSISGNEWGARIQNAVQGSFVAGMRVSNDGFFEVTNNSLAANPGFARLSSNGAWTAVSDRRLKSNIRLAPNLLQKVMRLRPVNYQFKSMPDGPEELGLIAQEVQEVFPEMVSEGELLTLNYAGLSVVAIGAIQEQQELLEAQQQEIADLKQSKEQLQLKMQEQQLQMQSQQLAIGALQAAVFTTVANDNSKDIPEKK